MNARITVAAEFRVDLLQLATVSFVVPGPPVPKARPRFSPKDGEVRTPPRTRRYEKHVGVCALNALQHWRVSALHPHITEWPKDVHYALLMDVYLPSARLKDLDNILKAVKDGMNKVMYNDDSQVVEVLARKFLDRKNPRAEIMVTACNLPPNRTR